MNTTLTQSASVLDARVTRPFYTRLAALGFVLIALAVVVYVAFGLLAGDTNILPFVLPIAMIALLIAGALWRFGAWAQILGALLSFLLLALLVPFSIFTLLHPESAGDFIPVLLFIVGAGFGFVGSVASLIQRRRHTLRATATRTESRALQVVLAVVALAAMVSLVMTAMARTTVGAQAKNNALTVDSKNFQFSPNYLQVKSGQTVRVLVKNSDSTLHTFTLKEAGVDVSIPPGAERLIEFQAPASGTYLYYCIPHSNASAKTGMVGSLFVQ